MDPQNLIEFRRRMNWTQRICARYIGVDQATWKNWESGKFGPSIENAQRLRAMIKLSECEGGSRALLDWAADDEARRAARQAGRRLHPNSRIGR